MGLTKDIGEVVATVLREGPDKHWGKDYYLSIEVLKMSKKILIIGATGRVGSQVIKYLEKNKEGSEIIYNTSNPKTKEKWEKRKKVHYY